MKKPIVNAIEIDGPAANQLRLISASLEISVKMLCELSQKPDDLFDLVAKDIGLHGDAIEFIIKSWVDLQSREQQKETMQ